MLSCTLCVAEPQISTLFVATVGGNAFATNTGATSCTIGNRELDEGEGRCGSINGGEGANRFCLSGAEGDDGMG